MKNKGVVVEESCLRCGKNMRDLCGVCIDCADEIGISDVLNVPDYEAIILIKEDKKKFKWFNDSEDLS